jgi:DNA-binding XRE family transcriptional regulator
VQFALPRTPKSNRSALWVVEPVVELDEYLAPLPDVHRECLNWFQGRIGQVVSWPGQHENGTFLVTPFYRVFDYKGGRQAVRMARRPISSEQREPMRRIGARIREDRVAADLTQEQLGDAIGACKYVGTIERPAVNVSATRLFEIASVLDTSVSDLFKGIQADYYLAYVPGRQEARLAACPSNRRGVRRVAWNSRV